MQAEKRYLIDVVVERAWNPQQLLDVCVGRRAQCAAEPPPPPLNLRTRKTTEIMARVAYPITLKQSMNARNSLW
jgi:hypothetical protein